MFLLSVAESLTTTSSNEQVFESVAGTIVSPNYPENYDNDQERYYKIRAPMQSDITLLFISFDVEYEDTCSLDYLEVSTFFK